MNAREAVLTALDGGLPDRVPCALSFYHINFEEFFPPQQHYSDLVDVEMVRFKPSPEEEELRRRARPYAPDTRLGTPFQEATYSRWQYRPLTVEQRNPLSLARSLQDLQAFPFPDTSTPYEASDLSDQVTAIHERGLAAGGNLPHLGGELFEAAWRLRGLETFLLDLIERPDWAEYLLDKLTDLAIRNAQTLIRAGVDVLALDDDVGMPRTMIIGPQTWRRFFKPRMARIIAAARAIRPQVRVLYHSDGYFAPIIPDLIEIGVNAINPLQPDHMDAVSIRQKYGPSLAFWGTVGHQTTFSFSKPQDIRQEVRMRIDSLGRAGLILCPAYDIDEPDIPWANIAAFLTAVRDFG